MASYKGRPLGTIGDFGCFSFHETKNIISGEGGALMINRPELFGRGEIIREKGTNRSRFLRGEVDKYTWSDIGSSFLPGEIIAAFLWAQMEEADHITSSRIEIWQRYHDQLQAFEPILGRPNLTEHCHHNGHMYYVINRSHRNRDDIIMDMKAAGINCVFHYVPLHSSPFGRQVSNSSVHLPVTDFVSANLIRLPIWLGLTPSHQNRVIQSLARAFEIALPVTNDQTETIAIH
jgi:dTDP-4-amino-4,6-dideoxygalactose transaminase